MSWDPLRSTRAAENEWPLPIAPAEPMGQDSCPIHGACIILTRDPTAGAESMVRRTKGGPVHVTPEVRAGPSNGFLDYGAIALPKPSAEVGAKFLLTRPPLDFGRKNSFHRTAENDSRPPLAEPLLQRQRDAELDEPPIEERVARLQPEASCGLVGHLQHVLVKWTSYPTPVRFSVRSRPQVGFLFEP